MTASFGVTLVVAADDLENALERADLAVYRAKHEGRNRVIASPSRDCIDSPHANQQARL